VTQAIAAPHPKPPYILLLLQVRTILSQNTTDITSQRAYTSLKQSFPNWELVRTAAPGENSLPVLSRPANCLLAAAHPATCLAPVGLALLIQSGPYCAKELTCCWLFHHRQICAVRYVSAGAVEDAIRVGGLADIKAGRIKVRVV
jgi:hypothetical protein